MKLIRRGVKRWVYVLPALHLCACFMSIGGYVIPNLQYWGIAFTFILLVDLPISIVAYALAWKYPTIAMVWIFVAGTLWGYLLSCGIQFVFDNFLGQSHPPHTSEFSRAAGIHFRVVRASDPGQLLGLGLLGVNSQL